MPDAHKKFAMVAFVLSLTSGILLALAFPKANLYFIAWIALAPLFYYLYRLPWKRVLISAFVFGMGFFASLLYWILIFGKLPWIALATYESLFIVAFAGVARLLGSRLGEWARFILVPCLWVVFEWLRSLGIFGFTWGYLSYSQYKFLPVAQLASLTGVWGISLLIAFSNVSIANLAALVVERREIRSRLFQAFLVATVVAAAWIFGAVTLGSSLRETRKSFEVAVVQGNFNTDIEWDAEMRQRVWVTYTACTLSAARSSAELVVWPETAVPETLSRDFQVWLRLSGLATASRAYLLVGARDQDTRGRFFNCAFLIAPDGSLAGRYAKIRLVPFGEFVPMRKFIPFLDRYRVTPYDLSPGSSYNLFRAGSFKFGVAICFESIFPDISRRFVVDGAQFLCVITNDSWFRKTAAAEQHMACSVFRAIENGRYVVRAAATGISAVIDSHGRLIRVAGIFEPAVLKCRVVPSSELTFYATRGDWLVYLCILVMGIFGVINVGQKLGFFAGFARLYNLIK